MVLTLYLVKNSNFESTCWPGHPPSPFPIYAFPPSPFHLFYFYFPLTRKTKTSKFCRFHLPSSPPEMAVELLGFLNLKDYVPVQEAAPTGLKPMQHRDVRAAPHQNQSSDFTLFSSQKASSNPNRTGHARFRRAQVQPQPQTPALTPVQYSEPRDSGSHQLQTLNLFSDSPASAAPAAAPPSSLDFSKEMIGDDVLSLSATVSTSGNSSGTLASTITGEGSVSNGKSALPSNIAICVGKPPLSGKRCREHDRSDNISGKTPGSSRCNCKKRYAYIFHKSD